MVTDIVAWHLLHVSSYGFIIMVSGISNGISALLSSLLVVLLFAGMQLYKTQLASSQLMTILGGYLGSLVFLFVLTAIGNFESHLLGEKSQLQLFPGVAISLLVSTFASGMVHRVCITTSFLFSLLALYCVNKISANKYSAVSHVQPLVNKWKK